MTDPSSTNQDQIEEISILKQRIQGLEQSEEKSRRLEEALHKSEEKFLELLEHINDIFYELDKQGIIKYCSPSLEQLLGYNQAEIIGRSINDFLHTEDRLSALENVEKAMSGHTAPHVYRVRCKSGEIRWIRVYSNPVREGDQVVGIRGIIMSDITDLKLAEKHLRESSSRYEAILASIPDIIMEVDNNKIYTWANQAGIQFFGKDVIGKEAAFYFEGEQDTYNRVSPLFAGFNDIIYLESWQRRKDGQKRLLAWHCHVLKDDNGQVTGALSSAHDITTRKHIEEALRESEDKNRELSIIDGLTQFYNSRYFYHQLKTEMDRADRYGHPFTLLLLDLDDFKLLNDAFGHINGDQVLLQIGQVVKRCLRQTDSAYRYGGEEFTILLPMTTSAGGAVTAERIRTEVNKEIFSFVPGKDVHTTVSIGLAQYKPQEDMKAFVQRVEQLMYTAKKDGKDRVCPEL